MFYASARTTRRTGLVPVAALTALATAGAGLIAAPATAVENADGTVTVDILGITDFHGRLEADGSVGGAAVLAGAVDEARAANPDTIFVSSGDNVGASTFTSASQQDAPTLEALNAMGLDVSALGNHEFDKGAEDLVRIDEGSDFPYVAANITGFESYGMSDIAPSYVHTTPSGVTVGFVGVTTPALSSLVSPAGIADLTIGDMAAAATAEADALSDGDATNGEADVVVVLAHDGVVADDPAALADGSDFSELVSAVQTGGNVDAVMGGHTHVAFLDETGENVWVTQAGSYSEYLTKLSFTYDPATDQVTASTAENVDLGWTDWDRTTKTGTPAFAPNAAVQQIVDTAVAQAEVVGAEQIGAVTADITRSVQPDGSENRGGESTLGNLLADLQLEATAELGTDIALMNPGGIRADLEYGTDGTVTYKDAALVQPFANSLMTFTLTGEQLKAALEQQWQPEGASRPFLKLGTSENLTYVYDPAAPAGEHVLDIQVDGVSISPEQQFTVVANSFLAEGGDNFTVLGEGTGHADAGRIDLNVMVDAFKAATEPVAPPAAQRAVGLSTEGLVAGREATLNISSLAFAADPELAGDTVTVSLAGTEVGTATLETTPTQASDETGTAAVTFTVPEELAGTVQPLTVTDGVTTVTTQALVGAGEVPAGAPVPFPPAEGGELVRGAAGEAGDAVAVREGNVFTLVGGDDAAVTQVTFGRASDEAFFADWDGDGVATPAIRRGNEFLVMNDPASGVADAAYTFGRAGDQVVVGDWDGDGVETVGVRRGNAVFLTDSATGGPAEAAYAFGRTGDEVFAGDFDGDGSDSVGVRRGNRFFLDNARVGGVAEIAFDLGRADDVVLVGDWEGDGTDTIGLRRGNQAFLTAANDGSGVVREVQLQL